MKMRLLSLFPLLGCLALPAVAETPVSVERLVSLPTLSGTPPSSPAWSPDGARLAFLWNDQGFPFRDLWIVDLENGDCPQFGDSPPRRLTAMDPAADALEPFGAHFGADLSLDALRAESARRHAGGVSEYAWSASSEQLYFVYQGDLHAVPAKGGAPARLTEGGGRYSLALSPDGGRIAYLRGGDLWLLALADGAETRLTAAGEPGIGTVPVGAFLGRDVEYRRPAWSADGRYIALEFVDRRAVRRMPIPSYLHDEPLLHEVRRGYPGDADEIRQVAVLEILPAELGPAELGTVPKVGIVPIPDATGRSVLTLAWSPAGAELLIEQDSHVGEQRWLHVYSPARGELRTLVADHRPRRIYPLFASSWSSDGRRIYYIDDHDGWYRLHAIPARGGRARAVTRGDFDVAGSGFAPTMLAAHAATRALYFVAAADGPYERHVYRVAESGGRPERITRLPGIHETFALSPDGRQLAVIASNDTTPGELYVAPVDAPERSARITRSPLPEFAALPLATPRYATFPSRIDDFTLHARIIEPPNLEPGKRYPVLIGNVYSETARNQWTWPRPISLLQQHLVHEGEYIIVQVDLRGSAGYGVEFREAFQGDWGGGDLEDLHSTVEYLRTLPHVDPERIGIWGNSYGGMLVLFALFERPGLFAAGVAGSPAIDPFRFTQYDQRLSRRPDVRPDIFAASSLLTRGERLEDPLMFIHGLHDDIVPFRTTVQLMEKLMLLGKDFDMVVPPESGHWWASPEHYAVHTFRKFMQFFARHVPPGGREAAD